MKAAFGGKQAPAFGSAAPGKASMKKKGKKMAPSFKSAKRKKIAALRSGYQGGMA